MRRKRLETLVIRLMPAGVNKLFEVGGFEATRTGYCRLTQMVPTNIILDAVERLGLQDDAFRHAHVQTEVA